MIPKESWSDISKLIQNCPNLFNSSAVIGVYTGENMCSSLLHSSNKLDSIVFYENFFDMDDDEIKSFKLMYTNWEKTIKNLEIIYDDGYQEINKREFNFISFDGYTDIYEFVLTNLDKFKNTLIASTDFGKNLGSTISISKLLSENLIYPVLHESCVLFFTVDHKKYNEVYKNIYSYSLKENIHAKELKFKNLKYLRLNSHYHENLKNKTIQQII